MKDLLFDTPLWLLAAVLIGGVALWWSGNNRQDGTLKRVGLVVLLLGLALSVVSYFIDTDQEYVSRQTRRVVSAVDQRDWNTLSAILSDRTSMAMYHNKTELVAGAKETAERIGLKNVRMTGMNVTKSGSVITVDFNCYSEQERTMGRPVMTSWRFDWQNLGSGWQLQTISPLPSQSVNVDDILKNLSRG